MTQQETYPRVGFGDQIGGKGFKPLGGPRKQGSPRTNPNTFGSLLEGQQSGLPAKELIHPGDKVEEMLMRTVLFDANECRDLAITLAKLREFGLEDEMKTFLELLAARCSMGGKGRLEFLQGFTGILSPALMGYKGAKVYDSNKRVEGDSR